MLFHSVSLKSANGLGRREVGGASGCAWEGAREGRWVVARYLGNWVDREMGTLTGSIFTSRSLATHQRNLFLKRYNLFYRTNNAVNFIELPSS
jgi:hypothetical protein